MSEVDIRWAESHLELNEALSVATKSFYPHPQEVSQVRAMEMKWAQDPSLSPERILIARTRGRTGGIIGGIRTTPRTITRVEEKIEALGIAEIFVNPEFQGYGIARLLVEYLITSTLDSQYDLLLGVARREIDGFYFKRGFYGLGSYPLINFSGIRESSKIPNGKPIPLKFLPISLDEKLNSLYETNYRRVFGRRIRTATDWKRLANEFTSGSRTCFGAFLDGQLIGYLILENETILEICIDDGADKGGFILALAEFLATDELEIEITTSHLLLSTDLGFDIRTSTRECFYGGHIVRIANLKFVMEKFFQREHLNLSRMDVDSIYMELSGKTYKINIKEEAIYVMNDAGNQSNLLESNDISSPVSYGLTRLLLGCKSEYMNPEFEMFCFSATPFQISRIDEF